MLGEILLYSVRICPRLIHLVYGYDDRNSGSLCVAYGFHRLRLNAVVCRNYEYCNIGYVSSAGTHGRKRLVTRSIQEHYLLSVDSYLGSTYVLGDSAGL